MKGTILTVVVAIAITAGIASAGIASLASGVAVLINATCHSGLHDDIAYSPSGYNLTLASDLGFRVRLGHASLANAQSHQNRPLRS